MRMRLLCEGTEPNVEYVARGNEANVFCIYMYIHDDVYTTGTIEYDFISDINVYSR